MVHEKSIMRRRISVLTRHWAMLLAQRPTEADENSHGDNMEAFYICDVFLWWKVPVIKPFHRVYTTVGLGFVLCLAPASASAS